MTEPWLFESAPDPVSAGEVTLMEGTSFCISDSDGRLGARELHGLFVRDTRVISRWQLALAGRDLVPLGVSVESPHGARFILHSPGPNGGVLVIRTRYVAEGMREDITLHNTSRAPITCELHLGLAADFADLFEVKEGRAATPPTQYPDVRDGRLVISTDRDGASLEVTIDAEPTGRADATGLHWLVDLEGHASWTTTVVVEPSLRGHRLVTPFARNSDLSEAPPAIRRQEFRRNLPTLMTPDESLTALLSRSLEDLATLRIYDAENPALPVVAAGAPWFMALFGRDSLLTSLMLLPWDATLARGTIAALGARQGTRHDADTEEEPGRILHELRFGPAGSVALGGSPAYYGTADATPLFALAVGRLFQWHPSTVTDDVLRHMDRALEWVLSDGDRDGDGFIEYARTTDRGLRNQGWKDSHDGVNFADGTLAEAPIALAEVQGYAYAAFLARADLAASAGQTGLESEWRDRAARLKAAFNAAFWLEDRGWYAIGLDRDKRPIDALTSNNGHCLWTGIADDDKAALVADHLLSPEMFTGWGLRTLGASMGAYDPMSYHNGSVWPHDTAICVGGLMRYGFDLHAQRLALGLLDAAGHFDHRLPELFAGISRDEIPVPVPYPAACSPQAWAAAAPVELVRALLRLEPDGDRLTCAPALPNRLLPMELTDVRYREGRYDISVSSAEGNVRPRRHS